MEKEATFVVVGGGIAGVTCVEQLSLLNSDETIILLTASPLVKSITNVRQVTKFLEEFDVQEKALSEFSKEHSNVQVIYETVLKLDTAKQQLHTCSGNIYRYQKLCLCAGGRPKVINTNSKYVLGIRDTQTVKEFQKRLKDARRLVIVGNGGIAVEIAYEIEGCEVIWAIKDRSIGATFFDPGAAQFFLPHLNTEKPDDLPLKRHKYGTECSSDGNRSHQMPPSVALGPDWSRGLDIKGTGKVSDNVHIEYSTEVAAMYTAEEFKSAGKAESANPWVYSEAAHSTQSHTEWSVYVELSNGNIFGCDFVISATGVIPNTDVIGDLQLLDMAEDGGIKVNEFMKTSVDNVYAAGDICTANWSLAPHWFQMRLWTQARQMGAYAAKCMTAHMNEESLHQDFCFEIFTHVTRFYGFKVILLGLFNAQGLGKDYDILVRVTKGVEYVKVVMQNGQMRGAILIGETDLEETFENLILNQMDLKVFGEDLLNPNIDIEDYFD